jgi:hypothetical protein
LSQLADVDQVTIRRLVAKHRSTSAETLRALASDTDESVRIGVAEHPAVWLASDLLWRDESAKVQKALANNAGATVRSLAHLAMVDNEDVRMAASKWFGNIVVASERHAVLRIWQNHFGELTDSLRDEFLARPEVELISGSPLRVVDRAMQENGPKLVDVTRHLGVSGK